MAIGGKHMARFDDATIIVNGDNSIGLVVHDRQKLAHASLRLPPAQCTALREKLLSPELEWTPEVVGVKRGTATVEYDHSTGLITLTSRLGDIQCDPTKEESLAKIVRRLKTLAPVPKAPEQEIIPGLPIPTDEELARRTIYKNPGIPNGYSGQGTIGKPKPVKASMASQRAKVKSLVAGMIAERKGGA